MEGAPLGVRWPHLRNRGPRGQAKMGVISWLQLPVARTQEASPPCLLPPCGLPSLGPGHSLQDPLFSAGSLRPAFVDPTLPAPPRPLTCCPDVASSGAFLLRSASFPWRLARPQPPRARWPGPAPLGGRNSCWKNGGQSSVPKPGAPERVPVGIFRAAVMGAGARARTI